MARGRMIDKVIILSRKINAVSEGAENLYYRIYVNTDDFGLFHADPEILKGQIYTLRKDISVAIIQNRLDELIEIELIKIYKYNSETYLEIVDFEKHQTFRKDYTRKYDYPKPDTKSYEPVQNRTESPTNINEIKLKETKLKEDKGCKDILNLLSKVKDYPFNEERDRKFIEALITEFPDLDALEEIKKKCAWWLSNPLLKKSNPHLQIRNWFINARKYLKEGDKSRKVGVSTHAPSKKEDDYDKARAIKMKQLQGKYQPEIDKAMKVHATDWLDEIDNKIKEEMAEFSREYQSKEGK